jgi:hypothetical protein
MANLTTEGVSYEAALAALLALYDIEGGGTVIVTDPTRLTLINLTKAKLDEVIPEAEGLQFSIEDDINVSDPLNLLINAILDEAAKRVLMNCPKSYLDPVKSNAVAVPNATDNKIGYIPLPANFLRFISLKMADWQREVTMITEENTSDYLMQFNSHVRGGIAKPKAIFNHKNILNTIGGIQTVTLSSSHGGGSGYAAGANVLTVVQAGGALGTINVTAGVGGNITSVNSVNVAGTGYSVANELETTGGTGINCVVNITAIVPAYTMTRILEYFSVLYSHTIDYLFYAQETLAENVQISLWDSLTWVAAAMVLQITERVDLANVAFQRELESYVRPTQ